MRKLINRFWSKLFYRYYIVSFFYEATNDASSAPLRTGFGSIVTIINDGLRLSEIEDLITDRSQDLLAPLEYAYVRHSIISIYKVPWFESDVFLNKDIYNIVANVKKAEKDKEPGSTVVNKDGEIEKAEE